MGQEVGGLRQLIPHLGQEGRAVAAGRQDDAVDAGAQPSQQVRLVHHRQSGRGGQDADFHNGVRKLVRGQRREARIARGGRDGIGLDVLAQGAVGLKAADAAAQRPARGPSRGQGHETRPMWLQPGGVLSGILGDGRVGQAKTAGDGAAGQRQKDETRVGRQSRC